MDITADHAAMRQMWGEDWREKCARGEWHEDLVGAFDVPWCGKDGVMDITATKDRIPGHYDHLNNNGPMILSAVLAIAYRTPGLKRYGDKETLRRIAAHFDFCRRAQGLSGSYWSAWVRGKWMGGPQRGPTSCTPLDGAGLRGIGHALVLTARAIARWEAPRAGNWYWSAAYGFMDGAQERLRLARDLHDEFQQQLAGTMFHLDAAASVVENPEAVARQIAGARKSLMNTQSGLRGILWGLQRAGRKADTLAGLFRTAAARMPHWGGVVEIDSGREPPIEIRRRGARLLMILQEAVGNALDYCRTNGLPDVVLSDVVMPRRDGIWLLGQMLEEFPKAKVLLLAGMPRAAEEEWARSHGAKGYVSKCSVAPQKGNGAAKPENAIIFEQAGNYNEVAI